MDLNHFTSKRQNIRFKHIIPLKHSYHKTQLMPVIINKRLLDAKSAADYLSISRTKLYQWSEKGKIPSVRIDSRRLFDVVDLDKFVEDLKTEQAQTSRTEVR